VNVGHLLTRAAQQHPDRPAWIQGEVTIAYREAEARVNGLAHALQNLGGRPGDRVAMLLPNCYQGLETILAPMKARMAVVPMNVRLQAGDHAYEVNDSGAFALVYAAEFREHIASIRDSLPSVRHFICVGADAGDDPAYEDIISPAPAPPVGDDDPEDLAWLFYTSGTTGQPKGAMLSHRNLLAMANNFLTDINPAVVTDILLHAAPITHGSGLAMFHHLARGAASAFPETLRFDPPEIFAAIGRTRATTMFLVPTMINILMSSPDVAKYDLSSLHTVVYGGGPMYEGQITQAIETFGDVFVQLFGQGEAPMTITCLPKAEHRTNGDPLRVQRLRSAGREVTGVRVRVVDADGDDVPVGETGEILVRGDLVMQGYWGNAEATAEALRDGWLHTGDMGHLDEDGYLYLTDRIKDLIISGGANVYPRRVEDVIARHPAVSEIAVIGVPDPKWGEAVKAVVALRDGAQVSDAELLALCRSALANFEVPKSVDFLPELPKNAYGKIVKREIREPYWAGHERRI
jgi:acyl-CoA synthetase (AMP-forming)/AMP-acid ligase II